MIRWTGGEEQLAQGKIYNSCVEYHSERLRLPGIHHVCGRDGAANMVVGAHNMRAERLRVYSAGTMPILGVYQGY
jgi:hypothetical protein